MKVSVSAQAISQSQADLVAIPLRKLDPGKHRLPPPVAAFDRAHGGVITAAIARGDFEGRSGQLIFAYPTGTGAPSRVLLVGLGEEKKIDGDRLRRAAGSALKQATARKAKSVAFVMPKLRKLAGADVAAALAEGAVLGAYRFDKYRERKDDTPSPPGSVTLLLDAGSAARGARSGATRGTTIAESQNLARDLSNEPPNELPPVELATRARQTAREAGLRCRVLDVPQMEKLGMGAILGVGQGSANPPRLIVLEHVPKKRTRSTPTICLVGKGVTFDTGGISIKPAAAMHEMKHDMSGAAAVIGAMRAVGLLGLPQHVVGIVGAAENMPGGRAYRPGDVLRSMSGKTIEILNTDAEGRVVLADALHYAVEHFEPDAMVDLATLTGACIVALGPYASGLFSQDDALAAELAAAGEGSGEPLWRLPLFDDHVRAMHSKVADLKNAGTRDGGASTAAGFLAAFTGKVPWAHLDIASTAFGDKTDGYAARGASGVGVRLLLEWLQKGRGRRRRS